MSDPRKLLCEAVRIVGAAEAGLITTVDGEGVPHARWMTATTAGGGLRRLLTLSCPATRKIAQVQGRPDVCWVFSSPDRREVVTLHGRATIDDDPVEASATWDRLIRAGRRAGLSSLCRDDDEAGGLVTIVTEVERIELISEMLEISRPRTLRPAKHGPKHAPSPPGRGMG